MSPPDSTSSPFTSTHYVPQSPKPHSPPETPSPSSPIKPHSEYAPLPLANLHPLPPNLDAIMSTFVPIPPDHPSSSSRLTPDGTPEFRPTGISEESPLEPLYPDQEQENSRPSPVAGMGIYFPPSLNPLPAELSSLRDDGDSAGAGSTSVPIQRNTSDPRHPFGLYAAPTSFRPRSTSPRLPDMVNSTGTSSSLGYPGTSGDHLTRERVISPTRHDFGFPQTTPGLPTATECERDYSPAADGKKEQSIRSSVPYNADTYDPRRGHHTYNGYHPNYPLSGPYKEWTATHEVKEKLTDSVGFWLCLYFFFNLGLTLFNKVVLVSFPFPYTLTGLHALSGCAGCYLALERGAFVPARLTQKENMILAAFSVLYTINIAVSNISLQLVTVPFHQVVRASTPLFTILISTVILRTRFSVMKLVSLLPVVAGVGFATYGDYYFTAWGLILTLLGTALAAMKTVVTNLIQTGGGGRLKLHPLDLLMRMCPLAFIQCVAYGWYTGELERVRRYGATQMTQGKAIALLVNGIIACGLNIVSFTANKKAGALTMTVSANCKQVLTIALAVVLFDLHINLTNAIGILLTLIGGGWYGYVEYREKQRKRLVGKLGDRI